MAVEMPAASEYAIVFAGTGDEIMPAAILGLRGDENLYLSADGRWDANYMPAFVRRYPFVFSTSEDGTKFTLCIDETFAGFNQGPRARVCSARTASPRPTSTTCSSSCRSTRPSSRDAGVLQHVSSGPARADAGRGHDPLRRKDVAHRVPRREPQQAAGAQPGETLAALAETDELELIYLHLQSMRNFERLKDRLAAVAKAA